MGLSLEWLRPLGWGLGGALKAKLQDRWASYLEPATHCKVGRLFSEEPHRGSALFVVPVMLCRNESYLPQRAGLLVE